MTDDHDVVVVGAGFAGLYMVHSLRRIGLDVCGLERADGVGGTWWWNRYPGARCDVESIEYSYSFDAELQQEWVWTERYASQPEILAYLEHVAERFGLLDAFRFGQTVIDARWHEGTGRWHVVTDRGLTVTGKYLVMATGSLSSTNVPDIPGLDDFEGRVLHTGRWPAEPVDLHGHRVGVIGTGSSGIQVIPQIAEQADHVVVFQRTPNFSIPARNRPLPPEELAAIKAEYEEVRQRNREMQVAFGARAERETVSVLSVPPDQARARLERAWEAGGLPFLMTYPDLGLDPAANDLAADFVKDKIRQVVSDPHVADRLLPEQMIGCKRLCADTGYYETFNHSHVHLVDLRDDPIERVTPTGVATTSAAFDLDVLVLATGFDAMTGSLLAIDPVGRDGRRLAEAWSAGPVTYLGLGVPGFPNMFVVAGPGSPSVLTNMVVSIEQHVEWISDCIEHCERGGVDTIEAEPDDAARWVDYVNTLAGLTLFPTCNSWYLGANVPGKPRVFMPVPGFPGYAAQCDHVAASGYAGFRLGRRRDATIAS
ncbi:MAG TPA: NAD(P)/FAD-dependent oxidoreductase [Nocardioidaceae bacterium]|nr:NAD(P)/FAD-dependent oxidoreductase [Nocardioidaceae bacterium]